MTDLKSVENYLYEHALTGVLIAALRTEPTSLRTAISSAGNALGGIGEIETTDGSLVNTERLFSELFNKIDLATVLEDCEKALAMIDSLEDQEMRTVFICRYVWRMHFSGIAKKHYMSETKIKTLNKYGLMILKERYG